MWLLEIAQSICAPLLVLSPYQVTPKHSGGGMESHPVEFSAQWQALGPFRMGTREAVWGADPLEAIGGFRNLSYDQHTTLTTSLGPNGTIAWQIVEADPSHNRDSSVVELNVDFSEIDWASMRSIYGWAALQYQGWIRGNLVLNSPWPRTITLYTDNVLEYWVDDEHYFGGDFFTFRRAPCSLTLQPGKHRIDVRLVREVRSMGGDDSCIKVVLHAEIAPEDLQFVSKSTAVSDVINAQLASPYASVIARNQASNWVEIHAVRMEAGVSGQAELLVDRPISLAPGQSRPIAFRLDLTHAGTQSGQDLVFEYEFLRRDLKPKRRLATVKIAFTERSVYEPHKMTFLHSSGSVSYAILRPPSEALESHVNGRSLPVLLNLHGAGLDAASHQVRHMLDAVPNLPAWTLFPTGMSPWSGDDWHVWGFADVQAALLAIPEWISNNNWKGPGVSTEKWLVSGHSNGGQGTYYIATHEPDKVIAAAMASGYSSIQNYVPYVMWQEAPPFLTAVVHNAMSSFKHELLVENTAEIPILLQHGSEDDNVPIYHSRLMNSLLDDVDADANYVELPGKPHWWEGAMTTLPLQNFYHSHLDTKQERMQPPDTFSVVVPPSMDVGPRWCMHVEQLESPDTFGRIDAVWSEEHGVWRLSTVNIHRIRFDFAKCRQQPMRLLLIDGVRIVLAAWQNEVPFTLVQVGTFTWSLSDPTSAWDLSQRSGQQNGALDAIMRSKSPFNIVVASDEALDVAIQISRNMLQYFGADSSIATLADHASVAPGNVITLVIGSNVPAAKLEGFPIQISASGISFNLLTQRKSKTISIRAGLGAVLLRPLVKERLELLVWGADKDGLRQAARLIPTLTGVGQPDFVVLGQEAAWKGHAGAFAAGFFDYQWQVSASSYVP